MRRGGRRQPFLGFLQNKNPQLKNGTGYGEMLEFALRANSQGEKPARMPVFRPRKG
jgi:hypothetical protein